MAGYPAAILGLQRAETHFSPVDVSKVSLELRHRVQVTQELRIEGSHDDTEGDEAGPEYGDRVQVDGLHEGELVLQVDRLDGGSLVVRLDGLLQAVVATGREGGLRTRLGLRHCRWSSSALQSYKGILVPRLSPT